MDANGCFLGPETVLDLREQASVCDGVESAEHGEDGTTNPGIVARLEEALADSRARNEELEAKVSSLSNELAREKRRINMWKNYTCVYIHISTQIITKCSLHLIICVLIMSSAKLQFCCISVSHFLL